MPRLTALLRTAAAASLLLIAAAASGADPGPDPSADPSADPSIDPGPPVSTAARRVFERSRDKLLQLRAVHQATQSQLAIGSGFIASADGLVISNYHVVSKVALEPESYAMEFVRGDGTRGPLTLLALDVVHDLAVLRLDARSLPYLRLRDGALRKGDRGYAMGNPHDLGLTIVEGTYNGYVDHALYPQIHFTGAINAGMSGGPAVAQDGRVFGVNVARLVGSQLVSFLVPGEFAATLLEHAATRVPPQRFEDEVRDQLLRHQATLMQRLLSAPLPVARFGRYEAPDSPGPFLRCWGRVDYEPTKPYAVESKRCLPEFRLYVGDELQTGDLRFSHTVLRSRSLGALRFASLVEERFGADGADYTSKKDLTGFRCRDDFVARDPGAVRAVLCVRGYKRFEGLYDIRLRVLTLDHPTEALVSALALNGVSYDRGLELARRYLERITWKN
jgi:S1-C subfamily serine protease